jgi:hypothetical protein
MRGGKGPPRPLLLWNRRHIVQNRATGGSRPRSEATALWRPPSPYLEPFQRNPFEYRVLLRYQCWFAGTTNGRGNVPLTDRNGQEEVALRENRHPIPQGVGTSLHRARIRDIRNILVGTLRGLGVRHGDGSCFDATAHARKLLPQAPAALPRTPQRVPYGGWEASQHWIVKPFSGRRGLSGSKLSSGQLHRGFTGIVFCFGLGRGGLGRTFRRAPTSPTFLPHADARRAGPPRT